ncbi:MAG: hypothetical protein QOK43_1330 [Acidimicrobiaceae bacterium]|nr:hypothetical protein [Acidimicrobiaceae bacterium]
MEKATRGGVPEVLAAGRFELVDPAGRVRAVVGDLATSAGEWWPGVALVDEAGSERVQLVLTDLGPLVSFAEEGNVVLEAGVADRRSPEARLPGPFAVMCEPGGEAVCGLRVDGDGQVALIEPDDE